MLAKRSIKHSKWNAGIERSGQNNPWMRGERLLLVYLFSSKNLRKCLLTIFNMCFTEVCIPEVPATSCEEAGSPLYEG